MSTTPKPSRAELLALAYQVADKAPAIGQWPSYDDLFMSMSSTDEGGEEWQALLDALGFQSGANPELVARYVNEQAPAEIQTSLAERDTEARAHENAAYLVGLAMGLRLGGRAPTVEPVEAA